MTKSTISILLFIFLLLIGCYSSRSISDENQLYRYKTDSNIPIAEYLVFHKSDSISSLHFKVNARNLLYTRINEDDSFTSNIILKYRLYYYADKNNIVLSDSASMKFHDSKNFHSDNDIYFQFDFKAQFPASYTLSLELHDINRATHASNIISINKKNRSSKQFFLVLDEEKKPQFNNIVGHNKSFYIQCSNNSIQSLNVLCFNNEYPLARPPFSMFREDPLIYKYDSVYSINIHNSLSSIQYLPAKTGNYHIQTDTTQREGLTLFNFYEDFPLLTAPNQLILPLRYLTTNKEYKKLIIQKDKKQAADNFWIENAGSEERALRMLKIFYKRIQNANTYFSSYHEGWKTDRGLIYIVYGLPGSVYRTNETEIWTYGETGNLMSITFNFTKVNNFFSENDYRLVKSPSYKDNWYTAMQMWGR